MDVDARIQTFDLKTKYSFICTPGQDRYNMPLYAIQPDPSTSSIQSPINYYPVYQGFLGPAYINGVPVTFQTQKDVFFGGFQAIIQSPMIIGTGNGTNGPYNLQIPLIGQQQGQNPPFNCILSGHIDITGVIAASGASLQDPLVVSTLNLDVPVTSVDSAVYITSIDSTGANIEVRDSGQFLTGGVTNGLLMQPGQAPYGNKALFGGYITSFAITGATQANPCVLTATTSFQPGQVVEINGVAGMTQLNGNTYTITAVSPTTVTLNVDSTAFSAYSSGGFISSDQNIINYFNGSITNLYFPNVIPEGNNIYATCNFYQTGIPRAILFYNNTLTLRVPPAFQYLVELQAYLSPAAFLNTTDAMPFGYMTEYIARGAARKILADTGDIEQFNFYEPLFREQEMLVWKRSQRQWTSTRTETLYSRQQGLGTSLSGIYGNSSGSF